MVCLRQLNAIDFDLRGGAGGGAAHVTRRKRNRMRHMVAAACFALRGPSPPAATCLHELAEMARVLDLHEWAGRPTKP